ncbi:MAG: hypothetical protein ACUVWB_06825 [Anaerolineae bacterium]
MPAQRFQQAGQDPVVGHCMYDRTKCFVGLAAVPHSATSSPAAGRRG